MVLNTFIFNTFGFCQLFNEINSRDMQKINVLRGMFGSWLFMLIIVSTVSFQIVIVEFLGTFVDTVPLSWELWLASVLIGAVSNASQLTSWIRLGSNTMMAMNLFPVVQSWHETMGFGKVSLDLLLGAQFCFQGIFLYMFSKSFVFVVLGGFGWKLQV